MKKLKDSIHINKEIDCLKKKTYYTKIIGSIILIMVNVLFACLTVNYFIHFILASIFVGLLWWV